MFRTNTKIATRAATTVRIKAAMIERRARRPKRRSGRVAIV